MIKLDRSEDDRVREIVQKLRPLVEEGRIIFVAFEDEVLSLPQLKTRSEVLRDAANQKRRLQSCRVKDPRQHRSGRGLAMSSGDDQHFLGPKKFIVQQLRHRAERNALIEQLLQLHVPPRDRI